jgi:hypothetical protein
VCHWHTIGPILVGRRRLRVITARRGVTRRRGGVIARRGGTTRGTARFFTRPIWVQIRHRRVTPRRLSIQTRRFWLARRPIRVESLKERVTRRAPLLLGGDGEVIRPPLLGQSVPIAAGIVAVMTPSRRVMTPPRAVRIPSGPASTPSRRHLTPSRREMTARRRPMTPRGRLMTPSRDGMSPRRRLEAPRGREMTAAGRLGGTRRRVRTHGGRPSNR